MLSDGRSVTKCSIARSQTVSAHYLHNTVTIKDRGSLEAGNRYKNWAKSSRSRVVIRFVIRVGFSVRTDPPQK